MSDITVALDAGHGGTDPGATYEGRQEKDDTLRLVKAVGTILESKGINVVYTRTNDIYETPFKKATDANDAGADYFVSIHRNSSERPNQYNGVETLVYNDDGIKAVMARNINAELTNAGFKNLGVDERPNLVVLKRTKMPAVLVEVGFINSDVDNKLFDENFNQIAEGIANGIIKSLPKNSISSQNISYTDDYNMNPSASIKLNNNMELDDNNQFQMSPYDLSYNMNDVSQPGYNPTELNNSNYDNSDYNQSRSNNTPQNFIPEANLTPGRYSVPKNMPFRNEYNQPPEKLYRVQTGAFREKNNADRMLNSLLMEGFPAFIIYDNGLYKVQVGAFRNLFNAIKMEQRLRRFRYNTYIAY